MGPKSGKKTSDKKMRDLEKKIERLTLDLDRANKKLKQELKKDRKMESARDIER